MEEVLRLVKEANKSYETADHLTYVTYPMIKEIKLLITISENLYNSLIKGMDAILYYDRLYKRIGPFNSDFDSRFDIFKLKSIKRYNFDRDVILLIEDLRNILKHRKESPMEFVRKNKYIMCNSDYNMKTLTIEKIKSYLVRAKPFFSRLNTLLMKNDRRS